MIDLLETLALAPPVRLRWTLLPLVAFAACKDSSSSSQPPKPEPEPLVSYSREVRPLLIENCLTCHGDFPLHAPKGWNLLHEHQEQIETPALLKKWVAEGSQLDPHWAGQSLHPLKAESVDDFLKPSPSLEKPREVPQAMFTASIDDLLAGDFKADKMRAISTGYFRKGDDSPEWRAEKVAQEFLGVKIECAACHDHPSEHWSNERYRELAELFTTPYDHIPGALPPLLVKSGEQEALRLTELKKAVDVANQKPELLEEDYQAWLALDMESPSLPGLVAAFSFESTQLNNLAPHSPLQAAGEGLIYEKGAHGQSLYFDGQSKLTLNGLPGGTEMDRFTISTWIKLSADSLADTPIATIGTRERGFEFRVIRGRLQARWIRFWPQLAAVTTSKSPLITPERWAHVAVSYDGSRRASGMQIFLNGLPIEVIEAPTKLMKSVLIEEPILTAGGKGLWMDELQIYTGVLTAIEMRQVFDGRSLTLAYQNGDDLRNYYQRHFGKSEASRLAQVRSLNEEILKIEDSFPTYLVMAAHPKSELKEDSEAPANRLEFAQRLNQDLLARSLANEVWRRHFGSPLTQSLGFSDPPPQHADLLEWLAGQLQKSNFDIPELGKLIRSSKAWTQEWPGLKSKAAVCPRESE